MQSLVVIKHGDILQNVLLCFIAGLVMSPLATFLLEAAKEAFRHCIIPTISQATHAANKTIGFQQIAVCFAGILRLASLAAQSTPAVADATRSPCAMHHRPVPLSSVSSYSSRPLFWKTNQLPPPDTASRLVSRCR